MTNTPALPDPIAQSATMGQSDKHQTVPVAAKDQSDKHRTSLTQQQTALQSRQKKKWTGFAEKTLWDWLNLLGVLLVPLILGMGTILITAQQSAISQSQHESDQNNADNQFQEGLLQTFRDDISHFVLDEHLRTAKHGDDVQILAQSYTYDALRKLDLSRRVLLVQFLSDNKLITSITKDLPLISLANVNLQEANLPRINLQGSDLFGANLQGAKLFGANLQGANLRETSLQRADLSKANLRETSLLGADLDEVNLQGAIVTPNQLAEASSFKDATFPAQVKVKTYPEQEGSLGVITYTNPYNASGMGPHIPAAAWVQASCKVYP